MEHYLSSQKTQLYVMYIQACFVLLHFADFCIVHKLKVCDNSASNKSTGAVFSSAFAHFVSLCHILVILTVFQTFFIIIIFVMMICDVSDLECY